MIFLINPVVLVELRSILSMGIFLMTIAFYRAIAVGFDFIITIFTEQMITIMPM